MILGEKNGNSFVRSPTQKFLQMWLTVLTRLHASCELVIQILWIRWWAKDFAWKIQNQAEFAKCIYFPLIGDCWPHIFLPLLRLNRRLQITFFKKIHIFQYLRWSPIQVIRIRPTDTKLNMYMLLTAADTLQGPKILVPWRWFNRIRLTPSRHQLPAKCSWACFPGSKV